MNFALSAKYSSHLERPIGEEEDESYYSRGFRAETPGYRYGTPLGVLSVHTNEYRRAKEGVDALRALRNVRRPSIPTCPFPGIQTKSGGYSPPLSYLYLTWFPMSKIHISLLESDRNSYSYSKHSDCHRSQHLHLPQKTLLLVILCSHEEYCLHQNQEDLHLQMYL